MRPANKLDLHTLDEAARRLQVSRSTLNRIIRRGELRSFKLGGHPRITGAELRAYAAARGLDLDAGIEIELPDDEPPAAPEPPSWVTLRVPYKSGFVETLLDRADAERFPAERLRYTSSGGGKPGYIRVRPHGYLLARVLLGLERHDPRMADHINRDRLDNRRFNLRTVTRRENNQNTGARRGGTSKFRGVFIDMRSGKWRAKVQVDGIDHYLGSYDDEAEAGRVAATFRKENMQGAVESPDLVPVRPRFRKPADRQSGVAGVTWRRDIRKWQAQTQLNMQRVYLGCFERLDDAIKCKQGFEAARELTWQGKPAA